MASSRKTNWESWCAVIVILTVINICTADNYFKYDSDDFVNFLQQPVVKLLSKRQVSDFKENAEIKKPLSTKLQTVSNPENSSNPKTVSSGSPVANLSDEKAGQNGTEISTVSPMSSTTPALNETVPTVDYNGENITVTNVTQDYHRYYNSSTYPDQGMQFWIDFDKVNASTHDMLSQSHRRAATVALSFDFPFYGHWVRNITIATGGFLYTGDYVHSWLAATQYIAPLMANFDTSMSNFSTIKYMDNGTAFSVQWDKVALQDNPEKGNFSFQATLLKSGDIIFAYKDIPVPVTNIGDEAHPVKVGVSDAYIIDRTIFFVRRKTIYEYHKVDKKTEEVSNGSAIYFTALQTCVAFNSCETCITNQIEFECVWCSTADRCSDGMDRFRQDWLVNGCDKLSIDSPENCSLSSTLPSSSSIPTTESSFPTPAPSKFPSTVSTTLPSSNSWDDFDPSAIRVPNDTSEEGKPSGVSSVIGILFMVAVVVGLGGWLFYAYRNPHTPSGQCFIRYRPSQWRWRSGEAHYTAAAIHM